MTRKSTRVPAPPPPLSSSREHQQNTTAEHEATAPHSTAPIPLTQDLWTDKHPWNAPAATSEFWGVDPRPPGGFVSYLRNPSSYPLPQQPPNQQAMMQHFYYSGGPSHYPPCPAPQPSVATRNPSPSLSKQSDQYWGDVTTVYNSTTPNNRRRQVKQAKDHWHSLNKLVFQFHCSWTKASAIYASGQSDAQLLVKAHAFYKDDYKAQFHHMDCWRAVNEHTKWTTYNEWLEQSKKRKTPETGEMEKQASTTEDVDDIPRPTGIKNAKTERNGKGKSKEVAADMELLDKLVLMLAASTSLECLGMFAQGVIDMFGGEFLRPPRCDEVERLLQIGESRGFPGMLGSIDCMHWQWEKYPNAWRGQFTRGDHGVPTMILEAVASQDLRIWHAYFGVAGSNNDINVLNKSHLFVKDLKGEAPRVQFTVNGSQYDRGYYLADGIYPEWAVFVKTIPLPQTEIDKLFARHQEGARKDVERAFGVLQSRFNIVRRPARLWKRSTVGKIMEACIILHNMIVEDEGEMVHIPLDLNETPGTSFALPPEVNCGPNICFTDVLQRNSSIRARPTHQKLKQDLVENIWEKFGNE